MRQVRESWAPNGEVGEKNAGWQLILLIIFFGCFPPALSPSFFFKLQGHFRKYFTNIWWLLLRNLSSPLCLPHLKVIIFSLWNHNYLASQQLWCHKWRIMMTSMKKAAAGENELSHSELVSPPPQRKRIQQSKISAEWSPNRLFSAWHQCLFQNMRLISALCQFNADFHFILTHSRSYI